MKPFDFQLNFITNIGRSFARGNRRVIAQASTGFGKGCCIGEVTRRAILKGNVVCISVHREEIFNQIYSALRAFGIMPSLIVPGVNPMPGAQCYLSMVETVCRRMDKGLIDKLNINFFILDEVHMGNYVKLINQVDCKVLGFTATPVSASKVEMNTYFDDIVCGIPLSELIKIGRLVPARTYSIAHDFSKVKKKGKEYDERSLMQEFKKPKLWEGAVKKFMETCPTTKFLCYSVNVEQSNATMKQFMDHGIKVAHVDGNTDPDSRKTIFKWYKEGVIQGLCNVGIATAGFDDPETETIIENYATMSLSKTWQVRGRGARCSEGKTAFNIIDMGRNYLRHGKYPDEHGNGDEIDWVHLFNNPVEATSSEEKKRVNRECEECGSVIQFRLRCCPYCGDIIAQSEMETLINGDCSVEEVRAYNLQTLPVHLRRPVHDMGYGELVEYARHMGYKPGWAGQMMGIRQRRR